LAIVWFQYFIKKISQFNDHVVLAAFDFYVAGI